MIAIGATVPEIDVYDGKGAAPLPVFFDRDGLLVFFRDNCRRCDGVLGLAAAIGRRARKLSVIGVSQETIEDTAEQLNRIGVRLPVVIDDRPYRASAAFGIEQLPALALIRDDAVAWVSDGCPAADLTALPGELADWVGDKPFDLHPDYRDSTSEASKHLGR
ncbi:MAG: hypothetical protein KJO17_07895 [Acidimicrobiia bacterium]|nr:hypothetical protein [Acidimicrobiia bacterium]NNL68635.1 hypothetical protein [Acidimicrobiia bacterium]